MATTRVPGTTRPVRYLKRDTFSWRSCGSAGCNPPIGTESYMTRQLSGWDHIWGLLQFDCLLVDESTLVMNDHVRVHWTIFWLIVDRRPADHEARGSAQGRDRKAQRLPRGDSRLTHTRKHVTFEPCWHIEMRDMSAAFASDVQPNCTRLKDRGRDDDTRDTYEIGDGSGLYQKRSARGPRRCRISCSPPTPSSRNCIKRLPLLS